MAKDNKMIIAVIIIAALAIFAFKQPAKDVSDDNGDVITSLVSPAYIFTGRNMLSTGTSLTVENVTIFKDQKPVKTQKMDGSTEVKLEAAKKYRLYGGYGNVAPSVTYYPTVLDLTTESKENTIAQTIDLCAIDTAASVVGLNEYGSPISQATNAQAVSTGGSTTLGVRVKSATYKCFGAPNSPKKNAVCFEYNGSVWQSVKTTTSMTDTPYAIASGKEKNTYQLSCYEMPLLQNGEPHDITVTAQALASVDPNAKNGNISVKIADISFDIDQSTGAELWAFQDESNNNLGSTTVRQTNITIT